VCDDGRMTTERVLQTIPILRIFSVEKAREFYVGFLGFTVDWEHRFDPAAPLYMQVSRGGLSLHLSEHHGDACPGSTVFVRMTGLESYHREITAKGYGYMRPGIERAPWNANVMEVTDPFGNRLRFNEDLKGAHAKP
jgi:catechol 2,3-dioxygenase-like lactoylglutathione lyase family enzyme